LPRFPFPPVCAILVVGVFVAGCGGTGDGGTGDPPSQPTADVCGSGARLSQILGDATWLDPADMSSLNCKHPPDQSVHVTGLTILTIDTYDETGSGQQGNIYVLDCAGADPPAYSGVTVFDPSFSPPDLRLAPGDVADALGVLTEFPGPSGSEFNFCRTLPEIGGTLSFRFDRTGDVVPKSIPVSDLATYQSARRWLGMLVRVEGVTIAAAPYEKNGRYTVEISTGISSMVEDPVAISNELYDLKGLGPMLAKDAVIGSVTGIVTYFYGFKIAPRSRDDIEL
jgi:hypothetical protein